MLASDHSAASANDFLRMDDWTTQGLLLVFVGTIVVVGFIAVLVHRFNIQAKSADARDSSMTRPVLALCLVGTLVILAAASLSLKDEQTRNLLVGGVVSLSSAVVAFYFASSGATEARRDLLNATSGTQVPDLEGKTFSEAQAIISLTSLALAKPDPASGSNPIKTHEPKAGTTVPAGTQIKLQF